MNRMDACSRTDIGRKRAVNQDYVFSSTDAVGELPNLFVVADGMGGHNAGEFASKFCVETFVQKVSESPERTVIGRIGVRLWVQRNQTAKRLLSSHVPVMQTCRAV